MLIGAEIILVDVMTSKGLKSSPQQLLTLQMAKPGLSFSNGRKSDVFTKVEGLAKGQGGGCSHYKSLKHTYDTYFKLHKYLE